MYYMASLKKRGKNYSLIFKATIDGKTITKTYALGTTYKQIAEHKKTEYEKLYQRGEIDPFDPNWSLKDYELSQSSGVSNVISGNYYLTDLEEEFMEYKSHVSSATEKGYKSVIKLFIGHVGQSMTANLIRPNDIRTFCFNSKYSNATQRNYLRHLKAFFNWMEKEEIIEENPCKEIKPPKKKDKLVDKIFDEKTLEAIFDAFDEHHAELRQDKRNEHPPHQQLWFKPLVITAYYTGLRRKELVQLRWEQVNLKEREIHVTDTKNGLERTVVIFDTDYLALKKWHKFSGSPKKGLVFPSPRSTDKLEIKLIGNNVSRTFKKYAYKKAKLPKSIHFHGLRHSCATYMIRKGFDVTMVKDMLGHRSIEVTMRYVSLVVNDRKRRAKELGLISAVK